MLVSLTAGNQSLDDSIDLAIGVEAGLEIIDIELDAELLQVDVLLVAQIGDREFAYGFEIVDVTAAPYRCTVGGAHGFAREKILCNILDIFAVIRLPGPAGFSRFQLSGTRLHR